VNMGMLCPINIDTNLFYPLLFDVICRRHR
jgi:hypothetical protein